MISEMYFRWFLRGFRGLLNELKKIDLSKEPLDASKELLSKRKRLKVFRTVYRFEKFLHSFIDKILKVGLLKKVKVERLYPEILTDVSGTLGILDDVYNFIFLVQHAMVISELYLLLYAHKENNLKIPSETKENFKILLEEQKIESRIVRSKEKIKFFEIIKDEEFERYFKMKKDEVKDLYIKLCNFVLRLYDEIRNIIK